MIEAMKGYKINFSIPRTQNLVILQTHMSESEKANTQLALQRLLSIGAIESCSESDDQFLSHYFFIPKSNGSHKFVLNLKKLNLFFDTIYFKKEYINTVFNLLSKDDYMCRIDLKDAFHLIPIDADDKKYLRFRFQRRPFQFKVLSFGLSLAPNVFTKVVKPVSAKNREKGVRVVAYLGDFIVIDSSFEQNIQDCQY